MYIYILSDSSTYLSPSDLKDREIPQRNTDMHNICTHLTVKRANQEILDATVEEGIDAEFLHHRIKKCGKGAKRPGNIP